jgi:hypothetical protein
MRKRCATPRREEADSFFSLSEGKGEGSVQSVEIFDQKVELDYSALTENKKFLTFRTINQGSVTEWRWAIFCFLLSGQFSHCHGHFLGISLSGHICGVLWFSTFSPGLIFLRI